MVKSCCLALLMTFGISLFAGDPMAKIDIDGTDDNITITPGTAPEGGSVTLSEGDTVLSTSSAEFPDTNWKDYSFSFTPSKDGTVRLILEGGIINGDFNSFWICFDKVEAVGAAIVNGDFEQRDVAGYPVGWSLRNIRQFISFNGNRCVRVRFDNPVQQKIQVKAGQEVTIRAKARRIKA